MHSPLEQDIEELAILIEKLKEDNARLKIENGLLRKASVEQRELNGQLRVELNECRKG